MSEFVGINGHYPFRPDLYRPVARLVRNYHDMNWDVAQPGDPPTFPHCVNGVKWEDVYGRWNKEGFEVSLCSQFVEFGKHHPDHRTLWQGREAWAGIYGREMAAALGPTSGGGLIHSIEIGNEPGSEFDDAIYRAIFRSMAGGIREGDPAVKIATCTVHVGPADEYHKSLDETFGDPELLPLFDIINLHTYATLPPGKQEHPWQRTFPEDPQSDFLRRIDDAVAWRDRRAPDKEIWVTEFGWDACTEEAMSRREGWFEKLGWTGQTELEQAQYLVRAILLMSGRPVDRAYFFWYDDQDEPSVHGSSGITRNFEPKPSYFALAQLQDVLGDFRFKEVISAENGKFIYGFEADDGREILAAWTTADRAEALQSADLPRGKTVAEIIPMRTQEGEAISLPWQGEFNLSNSVAYFVLK